MLYLIHVSFYNVKVCRAWCRSLFLTKVPIVTKEDQEEARKGILDEHLSISGQQVSLCGQAKKDEIAIANISLREQKYHKRKSDKALQIATDANGHGMTTSAGKENAKPP